MKGHATVRGLALASALCAAVIPILAADEIHWTLTGQTSVTLDWRGSETSVRLGTTTAYGRTVSAQTPTPKPYSSAGPFWEARITGLLEDTLYHYSIGTGPDHTFRTPLPIGSSDFTVYAMGDIGDARSYPNVGVTQNLVAADRPSFTLMLGDLTYGNAHGQASVDNHFNDVMVWSQDVAYMPAWGNHEWDKYGVCSNSSTTVCNKADDCPAGGSCSVAGDDLRNYKGRFDFPNPQTVAGSPALGCCGEDWYWFDYGNVRFIAIPEAYSGAYADWNTKVKPIMDAAQADPRITFIVTFGHRPSYSTGHHPGISTLKTYLDGLGATHTKYVLDLAGHSHNYERTTLQSGVIHVTAGTGGSTLEQDGSCLYLTCTKPSWSAFRAMHLGPLKLRFRPGSIEASFVCGPQGGGTNDVSCSLGSVIDTFTILAPGGTDTQSPTVGILDPLPGEMVAGIITVAAAASDNVSVAGVQFSLDGAALGAELRAAPWSMSWDTRAALNGSHTLTARARDASGNTTLSAAVAVGVNNIPDTTPPLVAVLAPAAGSVLSGAVSIRAEATDDVTVAGVQFRLDGASLGAEDTADPYVYTWNANLTAPGAHTLSAMARDTSGNRTTSAPVAVTVVDGAPPSVALSSPTAGSVVSGTVNIVATATDNVGVVGVKFLVDSVLLGAEDTASPWSASWTTTGASAGAHVLTAIARDAAGNSVGSAPVTVTVSSDLVAPSVRITTPPSGATISRIATVAATASDDVGVVGVQFRLNGSNLGNEDLTAPYAIAWDTSQVAKGSYTLTAVARDASGKATTSTPVTIRVDRGNSN